MISTKLDIELAQPTEYEMETVRQFTRDFNLDGEGFKKEQFIIAKSNNRVIGFGREKNVKFSLIDCSNRAKSARNELYCRLNPYLKDLSWFDGSVLNF